MLFRRRTSQADFEREVMPHLQALYGVALRMTKSEGDAEDFEQPRSPRCGGGIR